MVKLQQYVDSTLNMFGEAFLIVFAFENMNFFGWFV